MTKFKVGDWVVSRERAEDITIGNTYIVTKVEAEDVGDEDYIRFFDDIGDERIRMASLYALAKPEPSSYIVVSSYSSVIFSTAYDNLHDAELGAIKLAELEPHAVFKVFKLTSAFQAKVTVDRI